MRHEINLPPGAAGNIFHLSYRGRRFRQCITDVHTILWLTSIVAYIGRTIVTMHVPASILAGDPVPEFCAAIRARKRFGDFRDVEELAEVIASFKE